MTETSPVASAGLPPVGAEGDDAVGTTAAARAGCACGVEGRIVADDGSEQPWDGTAVGELEVRGPVGHRRLLQLRRPRGRREVPRRLAAHRRRRLDRRARLHPPLRPRQGRDQVRRRVDLLGRPGERADGATTTSSRRRSSAIPDEKWGERPLASVVVREGATLTPAELRRVPEQATSPSGSCPTSWAFIDEVPRTSVGKFDKKVIRKWYADDEIDVENAEGV